MNKAIYVIGGGLAGSEAAYQLAKIGYSVKLFEQRPKKSTEAHKTNYLAELVCSNSFKSTELINAHGLLKYELSRYNSLIMEVAERNNIKGGKALVVDREKFSNDITETLDDNSNIEVIREHITKIDENINTIIATGPLSEKFLANSIGRHLNNDNLYFYDAISPTVIRESIDMSKAFWGSRYNNDDAYLNIPLTKDQYFKLVRMINSAEKADVHDFDKELFFEGCLPVEEIARRGENTLRFGLMKPVGLNPPESFNKPYAIVQLRREDKEGTILNIVGFQTRMKYGEQKRILKSIPALKDVEIVRLGSMHRNTYINAKESLNYNLSLKTKNNIFLAGQITGVEGYIESVMTGFISAIQMDRYIKDRSYYSFSKNTPFGALLGYLFENVSDKIQPMNINFGLFPPIDIKLKKREKRELMVEKAKKWIEKQRMEILQNIEKGF